MLGKAVIKTWSSNQTKCGEAEYYALVKGASQGTGVKNSMGTWG